MEYNCPSADVIKRLKDQYADRSLHMIEAVDGEDTYFFVLTGPTEIEYKKFNDEVQDARNAKDEKAQLEGMRSAVKRASLAQIRHPDRDEASRIFGCKPGMIFNFAETIHNAAGQSIEVRSKKL